MVIFTFTKATNSPMVNCEDLILLLLFGSISVHLILFTFLDLFPSVCNSNKDESSILKLYTGDQ